MTDNSEIAHEFNEFFTNVGQTISDSVKPTVRTAESYLTIDPNIRELEFTPIRPSQIVDIVKAMEPKSSIDSDGISTMLLKKIIYEISIPLSHIYSLSMSNGSFPSSLKTARVIPIHKTGNPNCPDNYRPISLLSSLSKILEKCIATQLINHLESNNILYKHQYGFQKNKSTEHNLISATNFIYNAINNGEYCIGLFLDLKKAFDVCSHDILLTKLRHMGINNTALQWFQSYLSNRTQFCEINGVRSSKKLIKISVMQGSILGPILFLCYINDLWKSTNLFTLMFADDTSAFKSGKNLNMLINDMNIEINNIAVWFRANKMCVNVSKTKYIIFRARGKTINNDINLSYNANEPGQPIDDSLIYNLERIHDNNQDKNSRSYKLLGVYLDEYLTFNHHVNTLCNKLSKSLYCINRVKNMLSLKALRLLYFALFHPHINYCPIILNCTSTKNKSRIQKLQKKAIRTITKSSFKAHTEPLFEQNRILTFDNLIHLQSSLFMHSYVYNYAPAAFNGMWMDNEQRNTGYHLRNTDNNNVFVPFPRIELFKKSPLYSLPNTWNDLDHLKFQQNRFTFKWSLKCKYFNNWTVDILHRPLT